MSTNEKQSQQYIFVRSQILKLAINILKNDFSGPLLIIVFSRFVPRNEHHSYRQMFFFFVLSWKCDYLQNVPMTEASFGLEFAGHGSLFSSCRLPEQNWGRGSGRKPLKRRHLSISRGRLSVFAISPIIRFVLRSRNHTVASGALAAHDRQLSASQTSSGV